MIARRVAVFVIAFAGSLILYRIWREALMALTDAQRRAQARYVKESVKQTSLRFYPAETDLWEWLDSKENKQGYLKSLIRADMERERRGA